MTVYASCNETSELSLGEQFLTDVIDRLSGGDPIRIDSKLIQVLTGMASTGLQRLGAIRELIQIGAFPEAAILARSLIELQISAVYLVASKESDGEGRANRFLAFELRQRSELLHRATKEYSDTGFLGPTSAMGIRAEQIRVVFAEACQEFDKLEKSKNWANRNYREMIDSITDKNAQVELMFAYQHVYFTFSEFAHPTPTGIRHAFANTGMDEHRSVLLPFAVPLFSAMAVSVMHGIAVQVAGGDPQSIADLIVQYVGEMPRYPLF